MKSFFRLTWLSSEERKLLKSLIEAEKKKKEVPETGKLARDSKSDKPFQNLYFSDGNVTVVFHDGTVIMKADVTYEEFEQIRIAKTAIEISELLRGNNKKKNEDLGYGHKVEIFEETAEERKAIVGQGDILHTDDDFEMVDGQWFLKGVKLPIAALVLASFIELAERMTYLFDPEGGKTDVYFELEEKMEALKKFWCWLALCPIEDSRRDVINFIRTNNITIDKNGMLVTYRRVVKVDGVDEDYNKFVSESYIKVKKAKKGPRNYSIIKESDGGFSLQKGDFGENLQDAYDSLKEAGVHYTDKYTRTKVIKLGEIYREDEDKIDLDNTRNCSNGLMCSPAA